MRPSVVHDPVRHHIAAAGAWGQQMLQAVDESGASLSWSLLAFPPHVACLRVQLALGARSRDVPLPEPLADVLLPPVKGPAP